MRFLIPLILLGCPQPATPPDTDTDPVVSLGADPALPAPAGQARAGVVRDGPAGEAALFGGVNAEGTAGDVKIYNALVQFIVQGPYRSHGIVDVGGGIIDADLVRSDTLGRDTVEDVFLAFGISRLFHADTVEVLSDGTDGGDAVVVSKGRDIPWDYIQGALELPEPLISDLQLEITQTYRLPADSYSLIITTELTNQGDATSSFTLADGLFLSGEDTRAWAPGLGFEGPDSGANAAVLFTGRFGEATLSIWPEEGEYNISSLASLTSGLGINLAEFPQVFIDPGETLTVVRRLEIAPDIATAEADRWRSREVGLGTVSGTLTGPDGPVGGARVHFVDATGSVAALALTAEDGSYQASLPPGPWTAYVLAHDALERVDLPEGSGRYGPYAAESINQAQLAALSGDSTPRPLLFAAGRATPAATDFVLADSATVDLTIDAPSGVEIRITDSSGAPLPAVVELRYAEPPGPSPVPAELHDALGVVGGGRAAWAWTTDGTVEIPALPGSYELKINHSWRYGRASLPPFEVGVGATATQSVSLSEVVPFDGWLALDGHLHAAPSFDGALPMEDRMVTCAATGVQLPVSTDHDAVGDYRPIVTALGLEPRMRVIPGLEVTTILRGHFNMYPITPEPLTQLNGGAESWWYAPDDTSDLFRRMRESAGPDALLQVNHPRSPGMFGSARYDVETGVALDPDFFSWDFDAFELLNGGVSDLERIREDWFSFLNTGHIATPIGASDSHYRYIPCGMGRTDVYLDSTPAQTSEAEVRAALLAGHVVVASGTTLRAQLVAGEQSAMPGDTVSGGSFRLNATVRSPDWITPGTLRVYRNGVVVEQVELTESTDGLWFDGGWDLQTANDAWYAIEVVGTESLGDAWRNTTPYAMTNAFFVDVDGMGWSAPGLP